MSGGETTEHSASTRTLPKAIKQVAIVPFNCTLVK